MQKRSFWFGGFMKSLSRIVHHFFMEPGYTKASINFNDKSKGAFPMKYLGPILAGGLTLIIVVVVAIFSFLPAAQPAPVSVAQPQAANVAPPTLSPAVTNAASVERAAAYQNQIQQLNQAYQQRQAAYQGQIQEMANQINTAQGQLSQLKAQEQDLTPQVSQIEAARAERLKTYQAQLEQAKNQYSAQLAQLQAQLNEAQNKLAQANAQLGR
jgi:hypothetical protein